MILSSIEPFLGLGLKEPIDLRSNIVGIIGRNGSGKTRLLQAIASGKSQLQVNGEVVSSDRVMNLAMAQIQPGLTFGFDAVRHRDETRQAAAIYDSNRGKFSPLPNKSAAAIGSAGMGRMGMGRSGMVSVHQVAHIASAASRALKRDVNELSQQDIADYFVAAPYLSLGSLNATATMRAYWERWEENGRNEYQNVKYGYGLPVWTPEEFVRRFGPPPWDVFNDFLKSVLDGRYQIKTPTNETIATYEATLFRDDGLSIEPNSLSSGEKVLMWLCLSMYAVNAGHLTEGPKVLLLDEPDAALHPQMVQKMHTTLQTISDRLGTSIIFTTHSPTTVALFDSGPIFRVSEHSLELVDRDSAIGDLLVGVERVSINYTNRRQIYVESHRDAELYRTLFGLLRTWGEQVSPHLSLSFIPAAPKISPELVRQLLTAHLGDLEAPRVDDYIEAMNGQGNCVQVVGAVECLVREGSTTVSGIVDWDLNPMPKEPNVQVLGFERFYAIENAILNPLTLGIYLLQVHSDKVDAKDFGLPAEYDPTSLYDRVEDWQQIADTVTKRVLGVEEAQRDVECTFLRGARVHFDRRYVHHQGHDLEAKIRAGYAYPFLNGVPKRTGLLMEVVNRGIRTSHGRSMPRDFADLFAALQNTRTTTLDN